MGAFQERSWVSTLPGFTILRETWLRENVGTLFPSDDLALRDATWLSHLRADSGPVTGLAERLRDCFITQIERLGRDASGSDEQRSDDRLAECLVLLYLAEAISNDVFDLFWGRAPLRARRHAMWFLGVQLELPPDRLPPERRARAFSYWDRRMAAAKVAPIPKRSARKLDLLALSFFERVSMGNG